LYPSFAIINDCPGIYDNPVPTNNVWVTPVAIVNSVIEVVLYLSLTDVDPVNPVRYQKKLWSISSLPCSPIYKVSVYTLSIGVNNEPKSTVEPEGTLDESSCVQFIFCNAIYLKLLSDKYFHKHSLYEKKAFNPPFPYIDFL
jgi:hypothetical protein